MHNHQLLGKCIVFDTKSHAFAHFVIQILNTKKFLNGKFIDSGKKNFQLFTVR